MPEAKVQKPETRVQSFESKRFCMLHESDLIMNIPYSNIGDPL